MKHPSPAGAREQPVSVDVAHRNVRPVFLLGLVLLATFAGYSRTLKFEFVFDDEALIVNNPLIRESRFIPSYFERHLVSHVTPHQPGNYYRPVLLLWLFVNYQLFGINPMGWHLSTLLAHLGATVLVYFTARRLAGAAQPPTTFTGRAETLALFAALIFGLHPIHVENVAWIMGVTEPLAAIPTLASFLCYVRARQSLCDASNSNSHPKLLFAAALSLYAVALLSKETALVLPGILLAYEWFYHSGAQEPGFARRARAILYPLLPFLLLAAAYLALRMKVLGGLSHTVTPLPLMVRLLTIPSVVWFYVRQLVVPVGLSAFYDSQYVAHPDLINFAVPLLGVAAVAAGLWLWWRRSGERAVAVCTAFVLLPLVPLLNPSVFQTGDFAHDRYLYFSSAGFSLLLALGVRAIPGRGRNQLFGIRTRLVTAGALIVLLAIGTLSQTAPYASNLALYRHAVAVAPGNNIATMNLGNELLRRGQQAEAIALYRRVLARDPHYWLCIYNLGYAYYRAGNYEQAELWLTRAAVENRYDGDAAYYLGLALLNQDRLEDAVTALRAAVARQPRAPGYRYSLGLALERQGKIREALEMFESEPQASPGSAQPLAHIVELRKALQRSEQ